MNLETGASVGQMLLSAATMLIISGIAWGSLLQRVKTLEKQVEGIPTRMTALETTMGHVQNDVQEVKGDVKVVLSEIRSFGEAPHRPRQN